MPQGETADLQGNPLSRLAKYTFLLWLPMALLTGGILLGSYFLGTVIDREFVATREQTAVQLGKRALIRRLQSVTSDLVFLSRSQELHEMFAGEQEQQGLEKEFLAFSDAKHCYDQIRFLDETGMEQIRINFNDGHPSIVPEQDLQDKSQRYYFRDSITLKTGEVFVSPLDLNIEQGRIERPSGTARGSHDFDNIWRKAYGGQYVKPMMRFATPVDDQTGRRRGIVITNFLAAKLIRDFEQETSAVSKHMLLINRVGFWLRGPDPEMEWGFMQEHEAVREKTFSARFADAWRHISRRESGQILLPSGLYTFDTVYPLREGLKSSTGSGIAFHKSSQRLNAEEYFWKIISRVPVDVLKAHSERRAEELIALFTILGGLLAVLAWILALAMIRRDRAEAMSRQALQELRELNESLEERIRKRTRDLEEARGALMIKVEEKTRKLVEAKENLEAKVKELEGFKNIAVGREHQMIRLKHEINELSRQLGKEPPHDISGLGSPDIG